MYPLFKFPLSVKFFDGVTLWDMIDAKELKPVISALQKAIGEAQRKPKKSS